MTNKKKIKLLSIVEHVCREKIEQIDKDIRNLLESYCITAIGDDKVVNEKVSNLFSPIYNFENTVCGILVFIGTLHINEVMDKVFVEFEPGSIPPLFVIKFLGDLAIVNPFGMVSFIKALLGTIISIIPSIKKDIYRSVFSLTLASFAESIQEYLVNIEKAPDTAVNQTYFANDFDKAADLIFSEWIYSKDIRAREQAFRALGIMSSLLSKIKFDELEPKLMNALLVLYRRHSLPLLSNDFDLQFATQCLHQLLECIIDRHSTSLIRSQIDNILSTLYSQVCIAPDYQNTSAIRNHNEILRCFATLSRKYGDIVLPFILQKLETGNESNKIGSLIVLKHIINACVSVIIPKLSSIFFALRLILNEDSNKVRQMIIHVIITIAHHGYLNLEGGQVLIQFIIKQCALSVDENDANDTRLSSTDSEVITNYALKTTSENAMNLLVNTVEGIEKVLWPHLFEYLVLPEYSEAVEMLCRSLAFMGEKIGTEQLNASNMFEVRSNFPKPESLAARLCVIIGDKPNSNIIVPSLKLMKMIASQIDTKLNPLWPTVVDEFLKLHTSTSSISEEARTNKTLSFINQSLIEIDSTDFTAKFGNCLLSQLQLYKKNSYLKRFLHSVLGNVIRLLNNKNFSIKSLDTVFSDIDSSSELEREGFAYVAGQSAANHLDTVLVKLEKFAEFKRSSSIFGSLMDSMRSGGSEIQEKLRATIILSYGHITKFSSSKLLITRLETPILRMLNFHYHSSKDPLTLTSFIQSIYIIANSLHPENLKESYIFRQRDELLQEMLYIIKSPNSLPIHHQLAIDAIANLVKLEPALTDKSKSTIIPLTSRVVYSDSEPKTLQSFKNLLEQLLISEKSAPATLELLVKLLKPWLIDNSCSVREDAIETVIYLLQVFYSNIENWEFKKFDTFGSLVGLVIPRCFDPSVVVQKTAYQCLRLICLISNKLQAISSQNDGALQIIDTIINEPNRYDMSQKNMLNLSNYFAQKFKLESMSAWPLLKQLIDGMTEPFLSNSINSCLILKYLVEILQNELKAEIPSIIDYLLLRMSLITFQDTKITLSQIINALAFHHLNIFSKHLLSYPLHRFNDTNKLWQILAQDLALCTILIQKFLELFTEEDIVTHHPRKSQTKIAGSKVLAATVALREIFLSHSSEPVACKYFHQLFTRLLFIIAAYLGVECYSNDTNDSVVIEKEINEPSLVTLTPIQIAIEGLKNLLARSDHKKVLIILNNKTWQLMESEPYFAEAISILARALCTNYPSDIPNLVTNFSQSLSSQQSQKLISVIFFSEILSIKYLSQDALVEPLLQTLISMSSDISPIIRKVCIQGMAQFATFSSHLVS